MRAGGDDHDYESSRLRRLWKRHGVRAGGWYCRLPEVQRPHSPARGSRRDDWVGPVMGDDCLGLGAWCTVRDSDPRLVALYQRHYSADIRVSLASRLAHGVSGPGQTMCLLTLRCDAGYIWRRDMVPRADLQVGVNCSFFRNEGPLLSSDLVREACQLAWARWPGERLWTYVSPTLTRHKRDPGRCFRKAGWVVCGQSRGGLVVLGVKP